jgi:hypothetical protein
MVMREIKALEVFRQNNGEITKAYYQQLDSIGPLGRIATALFRAQKRSSRAKDYRPGRYRRAAYDVKEWSLKQLCAMLAEFGADLGFLWGWKEDPGVLFGSEPSWVLYVDIPGHGQCSFHSPIRSDGPAYMGDWDNCKLSADRIIQFCDAIMLKFEVPA